MSREGGIATGLAIAVVASAIAVVGVQHEHRKVFATMQEELEREDELREEWRTMQLEESAWAGHSRLERVAREELGMELPERDEIVILRHRSRSR